MTRRSPGLCALFALLVLVQVRSGYCGGDPPFPYPDQRFTLGEFLRAVAGPNALNLNIVVRESVPRDKPLDIAFRGMTARQALDLVIELEELKLVEFRPGLFVVTRRTDRFSAGGLTQRRFQLSHTTAERFIAALRASPRLAARVDVDRLSAGTDPKALIAVDSPDGLAALTAALGALDVASGRAPTVIPVSFLERQELDAALRALGPEALAGLRPEEIAHLPNRRGLAVNGTPEQIRRLRAVLAQLDVPPETVMLGVATTNRVSERARRSGIDTGGPIVLGPGGGRIGGQPTHDASSSSSNQSGILWVTAMSGSPSRIGLEQIFNVPIAQSTVTSAGGVQVTQSVSEVPVGLALEVLPRVAGRVVMVSVNLVDSTPNRVTEVGVDRSTRNLVTNAMVPRGGSVSIGGLATALAESGRPDALGLLRTRRARRQDLMITLFAK